MHTNASREKTIHPRDRLPLARLPILADRKARHNRKVLRAAKRGANG